MTLPGQSLGALAVTLAAPAMIATLLLVVVVIGEAGGRSLLSEGGPLNIAEAAGTANAGELLRRLGLGEDPTHLYDVRPHILSSDFKRVTALEAAVGARRVELVRLLDRRGLISGAARGYLACLASDLHVSDIVSYLAPDGATCPAGATLQILSARRRESQAR